MSTDMFSLVDNWPERLTDLEIRLIEGGEISFNEALALTDMPDEFVPALTKAADNVRRTFTDNRIDLCSIINARSGRCPEDCKFCTQSSHYDTKAPEYAMKSVDEIVSAAKDAEAAGAHRFCIVTSGKALGEADFKVVVDAVARIKNETGMRRCASIGALSEERAERLRAAGLNRYHHNVETAAGFFKQVCSTHTYDDKIVTIEHLEKAGIEKCVGGILNLGEAPRQRIEFAFELKMIDPISVPINFLNARPGTPLADRPPLPAIEALKYLAIFRLVMPGAYIRLAGGRTDTFGNDPDLPFKTGINALLIGDLLTTTGPEVRADLRMLESLGFELSGEPE
jgi:biotin synthase